MAITAGIFGNGTNLKDRYISDQKKLALNVKHWKELGLRIVLTSGTYDLFHVGHAEYLERAKDLGDLLIVGVDSDEKVRARKGPHRPVVPEDERIRVLSHLRHVDAITIKPFGEKSNALIKLIRPDVLVMSKSTKHKREDIEEKKKYCGKVVLLEPQAETSTSAKVRLLHVSGAGRFAEEVVPKLSSLIENRLAKGSKELAQTIAQDIPKLIEDSLRKLDKKEKR
jgi:rfaE bifunctional protein nucleotidyltransferase chain/domain